MAILRYRVNQKKLEWQDTLRLGQPWPERISPAGLCLDDARGLLYVVTKENHSLYVLDTRSKAVVHQEANLKPFKALPANVDLDEMNVAVSDLQRLFETFDMSAEDRAPDLEFNRALWKAIKGEHSEMPAPRRAAFLRYEVD